MLKEWKMSKKEKNNMSLWYPAQKKSRKKEKKWTEPDGPNASGW